ncbi:hypothetical protein PMAYCL1PPCAC_03328 [Pristionchus mayeri]|uniref:F-box domain-containing protein n=1 Tax=Pristionchus mayeri TaxID=1317129 RepID=A0AAN4Z728_9BILA|nr:hypothetical protein PMAYCL1PPCAC_03328 [Pristionchus mayeri]
MDIQYQVDQVPEATMHSLPPEILSKIVSNLNLRDRICLRSVDKYINRVEKISGYRQFGLILYDSDIGIEITEEMDGEEEPRTMRIDISTTDLVTYLMRGEADELAIRLGVLTDETAQMLCNSFKTLHFQQLTVHLEKDSACRFVESFIREHPCIEHLEISLSDFEGDIERVKEMLLTLPPMTTYRVLAHGRPVLTNDTLLHLVRNSSNNVELRSGTKPAEVTAIGLYEAFEIVNSSPVERKVDLTISRDQFRSWLHMIDLSGFSVNKKRKILTDYNSGTTVDFSARCPYSMFCVSIKSDLC